ncbi:MAG: hypothetical protein RM368_21470 [Nostoc sp. DedSLP03]|uniref:hypothetical protein n=1 Tax=Nostoc sp. DedSLP03 TaxID=3075400 RepID=UPI002AD4A55F|nr:hypothetical protein [Nostoc sp. DedSLP03]MDZ7967489.1 hypothetical protein [Nostoc sp. DedSLP03]
MDSLSFYPLWLKKRSRSQLSLNYQRRSHLILQFRWSDVFDGLRLRPQNTIIPPHNKNILVWNKNVLTWNKNILV